MLYNLSECFVPEKQSQMKKQSKFILKLDQMSLWMKFSLLQECTAAVHVDWKAMRIRGVCLLNEGPARSRNASSCGALFIVFYTQIQINPLRWFFQLCAMIFKIPSMSWKTHRREFTDPLQRIKNVLKALETPLQPLFPTQKSSFPTLVSSKKEPLHTSFPSLVLLLHRNPKVFPPINALISHSYPAYKFLIPIFYAYFCLTQWGRSTLLQSNL